MTVSIVAGVVVFGGIALILPLLFAFMWLAPGELSDRARHARPIIVAVILAWLSVAIFASLSAGLSFPVFLPFALVPIAAGLALTFHPAVAEILSRIPAHWLVFLSIYRVLGFVFLTTYWMGGDISWGFARNAGWGDVLTGVLAAPVGWMVWRRVSGAGMALMIWTVIGVGDLIVAPLSALAYGAGGSLTAFPLNMVPLFLGPPFGILLHLVTLRAYLLQHGSNRTVQAAM